MRKTGKITTHSSKWAGMTLVELIATMAMVLMISGALFWMFYGGFNIVQASVTRVSGNQDLQVATTNMLEDLRYSDVNAVVISAANPKAIALLSAFDSLGNFVTDSSGGPVWQKCIVYYIPAGTTKLLRKEVIGTFTSNPTISQISTYCDGKGRLLSPAVTGFNLALDTTTDSALLTLTVQSTNNNGLLDSQSKQTRIYFLN